LWRGLAPIAAVREGIIIDLFSRAWRKNFMRRGARPDYALVAPQGITKTERDELEASLIQKFSGAENWHKPIILEEGVTDIKTFSF
ncbi:phage portal protein, partial [Streptococcus pneumoniae]